ncbi:hypothetical protein HZ326_20666 [Fusarium oxysporum f. sp. albedinis]|nr:hypothetical protein HZ326_20666 [Fusarium oxysporum f. sp. albedinis]
MGLGCHSNPLLPSIPRIHLIHISAGLVSGSCASPPPHIQSLPSLFNLNLLSLPTSRRTVSFRLVDLRSFIQPNSGRFTLPRMRGYKSSIC